MYDAEEQYQIEEYKARIRELEAQIAAKDAALRLAFSRLDPMAEADETIAFIEAALAHPATAQEAE